MTPYKNLHGNSPITAYEYDACGMRVKFKSRKVYEYLCARIGNANFQTMKQLAEKGAGLSAFITKNVRDAYSRFWME